MSNVIIGIHGLGNKPKKHLLEHWWKLAMLEGLKKNKKSTLLPKFKLVYWADILYEKPLDEQEINPGNPNFLDEPYITSPKNFIAEPHKTRIRLMGYLNRKLNSILLNDDFTLNYSFITDSLINKYFRDLEIYYSAYNPNGKSDHKKANQLIKDRLLQVLEKYKKDDIMLICHSMGSIVAFDVLTFLAPHIKIKYFVTIGSPLGLPVVVSKIATEQMQYKTNGNFMKTPDCVTDKWYNFSDITDKVAFNYKLDDDFAENAHHVKPVDFLITNDYVACGHRNPHKSFGYLRTSEFANILDQFIREERLSINKRILRTLSKIFTVLKSRSQTMSRH